MKLAHKTGDPTKLFVIKTINLTKLKHKTEEVMEELLMMKLADHKQIVKTFEIYKEDDQRYLVFLTKIANLKI